MTGETYIKRQLGPVPKDILNILGELEHENAIVIRDRPKFGMSMREYIARTQPDVVSLATHGRGFSRLLLGGVADELIRTGDRAVLAFRPHDAPWTRSAAFAAPAKLPA